MKATRSLIFLLRVTLTLILQQGLSQTVDTDLEKYRPKRFIDKVEVLLGPGLMLPDDHGWSSFVQNNIPFHTFTIESKVGYSVGIGLIHSLNRNFEMSCRLLLERKGYIEENILTGSGTENRFVSDHQNDYVSVVALPVYKLGKRRLFQVFAGVNYSYLTSTLFTSTQYLQGVIVSQGKLIGGAKSYELSVVSGLGYSINLGLKTALNFQIQYNLGLTDIINENGERISCNALYFFVGLKYKR